MLVLPPAKRRYDLQKTLSVSAIQTFSQCPLKYRLGKLDKLPQPPTEETLRGNFVHSILEELFKLPAVERTAEAADRIAEKLWLDEWQVTLAWEMDLSDVDLHNWRWASKWCIDEYFKLEDPALIVPSGMEAKVRGNIEGVPFFGVVDRWTTEADNTALVTDYKTGRAPAKKYEGDKIFQLMVYAALGDQTLPVPVRQTELLFLKDPGKRLRVEVTDAHMNAMKETVTTVHAEMKTAARYGEFEPRKGPLCDWCNFKPICPAHNPEV